jgi:hypothetical protein
LTIINEFRCWWLFVLGRWPENAADMFPSQSRGHRRVCEGGKRRREPRHANSRGCTIKINEIPDNRIRRRRLESQRDDGRPTEDDLAREHFGPRGERKEEPNSLPLEANMRRDWPIGWATRSRLQWRASMLRSSSTADVIAICTMQPMQYAAAGHPRVLSFQRVRASSRRRRAAAPHPRCRYVYIDPRAIRRQAPRLDEHC